MSSSDSNFPIFSPSDKPSQNAWLFSYDNSSLKKAPNLDDRVQFLAVNSVLGRGERKGITNINRDGLKILKEQARIEKEEKEQRIRQEAELMPKNPETLEHITLVSLSQIKKAQYVECMEKMSDKALENFQLSRMILSKTIMRAPTEANKNAWKIADAKITALATTLNEINAKQVKDIQINLNGIAIFIEGGEEKLGTYISWINDQLKQCREGKKNPIIAAAQAYRYFLFIHPYQDGNGRIARFMMDLILQHVGLPPDSLLSSDDGITQLLKLTAGEALNYTDRERMEQTIEEARTNITKQVYDFEYGEIDNLVLGIKRGIINFCQQNNLQSPFLKSEDLSLKEQVEPQQPLPRQSQSLKATLLAIWHKIKS